MILFLELIDNNEYILIGDEHWNAYNMGDFVFSFSNHLVPLIELHLNIGTEEQYLHPQFLNWNTLVVGIGWIPISKSIQN